MPKRVRSLAQRVRDRLVISELYLAGKIQSEIASELGISQATVSRDIRKLIDEWQKQAVRNVDEVRAIELAKVNQLERVYWAAWQKSQQARKSQTVRMVNVTKEKDDQAERVKPKPVEQLVTVVEQVGDRRFLEGVQWCIEQRCRILGVDRVDSLTQADWRKELEQEGVDVGTIFERIIQEASNMINADTKSNQSNGSRSDLGSTAKVSEQS